MALTRATDKIIANADGNLNLSGIVTATKFIGDISEATGATTWIRNCSIRHYYKSS